MRARIIRVDGSTEAVDIPQDFGEQMCAAEMMLGCNAVERVPVIERTPGRPGLEMWIDSEGLFTKSANVTAELMAKAISDAPVTAYIAGDVLLTGGADSEGDTLGLTEIQDSVLAEFIPYDLTGILAAV